MLDKDNFDNIIKRISKEDFINYYSTHSKIDTLVHFNISGHMFNRLKTQFNFKKSKEDIYEIRKKTNKEKYGIENPFQDVEKIKTSYIKKDGSLELHYAKNVETVKRNAIAAGKIPYSHSEETKEKYKQTCLDKYGSSNYFSSEIGKETISKTKLERYGDPNYGNLEKMKQTNLIRYGVEYNFASTNPEINGRGTYHTRLQEDEDFRNAVIQKRMNTCKNNFGEDYYINQLKLMLTQHNGRNQSLVNRAFADYLLEHKIKFEREFSIGTSFYDFKIGNYLLEINPYATHNSSWGIFGNIGKDMYYHRNKTLLALKNGYRCIHIWDWVNIDQIIYHILYNNLNIIDTGAPVKHIYDFKRKELTNIETSDTVIIYDDGFSLTL